VGPGSSCRNLFASLSFTRTAKKPLFEVISLRIPTAPHEFSFESSKL
jgi:hypothetical protein